MTEASVVTPITSLTSLSRAQSIRGWMSDAELAWLARVASRSNLIVEIGTFAGRSTRAMGDALPFHARLISVDPYVPYESEPDIIPGAEVGQARRQEAIGNLQDLIDDGIVDLLHMTSVEAASLVADNTVDLVFLDGDHSYSAVLADIDNWTPKLRRGGMLAGHDYGVHLGVTKAVQERFSYAGYQLPAGSIWAAWKARM